MNKIVITGRLVRDPELRQTASGISVCSITVAVDRRYSSGGERQTDFFPCVFWRQGAEFVAKYFSKGKMIAISGEMQSRKYEDKNGNNRIVWEIQNCEAEFVGGKNEGGGAESSREPADPERPAKPFEMIPLDVEYDEDLPF